MPGSLGPRGLLPVWGTGQRWHCRHLAPSSWPYAQVDWCTCLRTRARHGSTPHLWECALGPRLPLPTTVLTSLWGPQMAAICSDQRMVVAHGLIKHRLVLGRGSRWLRQVMVLSWWRRMVMAMCGRWVLQLPLPLHLPSIRHHHLSQRSSLPHHRLERRR